MKEEEKQDGYTIRLIIQNSNGSKKEQTQMIDGFQLRQACLGKDPIRSTVKENLFSSLKDLVKEVDKPKIILLEQQ